MTSEQLDFGPALRDIPNRGLLMPNISLAGLNYLQQIADANTNKNQHFEPGMWIAVPPRGDQPTSQHCWMEEKPRAGRPYLHPYSARTLTGPSAVCDRTLHNPTFGSGSAG